MIRPKILFASANKAAPTVCADLEAADAAADAVLAARDAASAALAGDRDLLRPRQHHARKEERDAKHVLYVEGLGEDNKR